MDHWKCKGVGGASAKAGWRGQKAVAYSCREHGARSTEHASTNHPQRVPVRQSGDWCLTSLSGGLKYVRFREEVKISSTFMGQIKLDRLNSYTLFSCGSRLFPWWLERAEHAPVRGPTWHPPLSHSGNLLPNGGVLKYIVVTITW